MFHETTSAKFLQFHWKIPAPESLFMNFFFLFQRLDICNSVIQYNIVCVANTAQNIIIITIKDEQIKLTI